MSTRSSNSCCSCRSTESRSLSTPEGIVGSNVNKDAVKGRSIIPSLSATSSFNVVQSQFQDLMHLKNVVITKARQQMNVKNYILTQQKERLSVTSAGDSSQKDDTEEVYSPREEIDAIDAKEETNRTMITLPCDQYETLMRQLEVERIEHAKTKTKCEELADRLDFARGQIEILEKQLQREKDNFRQILGSVQESNQVGDERKGQLEIRVRELHQDNQQLAQRLRSKDSQIEKLQQALAKEKSSHDQQIIDMEVRRCQEDYISTSLAKTGCGRLQYAKKGYPSVKSYRKTKLLS